MPQPHGIETVAVLGTGIMGPGIAQAFATAGFSVRLIGRRQESLDRAAAWIEASVAEHRDAGLGEDSDAWRSRLTRHVGIDAAADADLVVEAITENVDLKLEVFEQLGGVCRPEAILASSSGHQMSALDTRLEHPERAVAAQFWNPPDRLPLVEVCPSPKTDPGVVERLEAMLWQIGKRPVRVNREIDGLIANRLQFALWREALNLWASGVASAEDIDAAATASFGRRLAISGPIATAELGGLRTWRDFGAFLLPALDTATAPPAAVDELLERGESMLSWSDAERAETMARRDNELLRHLRRDRDEG